MLKTLGSLAILSHLSLAAAVQPQQLEVRLQTHLSSYASPVGSSFRCVVIRPLEFNGRVVIPAGSFVFGTVRKEQRVGLGLVHERAALELEFDTYETPDGRRFPITATLASIDNSREQVLPSGRIKGVLAANNPGNLLNGFWLRPSFNLMYRAMVGLTGASNQVWLKYSMGPAGVAGLFVARCLILPFPEPEIHLPPGTDMHLGVKLAGNEPTEMASAPLPEVSAGFGSWLKEKLSPIYYANGEAAPDVINVVVLGSKPEIVSSFLSAGWAEADHRSLLNSSHVYQAFSSMRSYASAPVSRLYYHDAEPDLVFEKSLNTVTQRHHIRLWSGGKFEGVQVWLGAATHDTGVKFRLSSVAFTHKIDREVDAEREKVVTDLTFAGCSGSASSLDIASNLPEASDGRITTDGHLRVLSLQPCVPESDSEEPLGPPGSRFTRLTRRVILEARNYIVRDNTYYWAYQVIRKGHLFAR